MEAVGEQQYSGRAIRFAVRDFDSLAVEIEWVVSASPKTGQIVPPARTSGVQPWQADNVVTTKHERNYIQQTTGRSG
jgi:hypothetical protein